MRKCIYCGEEKPLSMSDIIPDFMTNKKIKRHIVCIECNKKCSNEFESDISKELAFITNDLEIENSKSQKISQPKTQFSIDNIQFITKATTTKSDIFRDGITNGMKDGVKYQLAPIVNLKKRSNYDPSKVTVFTNDMNSYIFRILADNESIVNYDKSYNSNLKTILNVDDKFLINGKEEVEIQTKLYYSDELLKKLIKGYNIFMKFYYKEVEGD